MKNATQKKELVKNVPEYAYKHKYWIVYVNKSVLWFYGAWSDYETAILVKNRLGDDYLIIS